MFVLRINTGNAAFGESVFDVMEESARILEQVAAKLREGVADGSCHDSNGNRVGSFLLDGLPRPRKSDDEVMAEVNAALDARGL